jgi:nucleoside-diphosphate-sugar epimerase
LVSAALRSPIEKKAYFVGDGNTYSQEEFHQYIGEALNPRFKLLKLPIWLIKIYAYLGILSSKINGNYPVLYPERVNELKAKSWECDTSSVKNDFNFIPSKTLREAIHETAEWYMDNKWIT